MLLICFEVFLYAAVVEEKSSTCIGGGVIELQLCKRKKQFGDNYYQTSKVSLRL